MQYCAVINVPVAVIPTDEPLKSIYEGLLGTFLRTPSGSDWDAFATSVINRLQRPEFSGMPVLPPTAAPSEVCN